MGLSRSIIQHKVILKVSGFSKIVVRLAVIAAFFSPLAGCGGSAQPIGTSSEITPSEVNTATKFVAASFSETEALVKSIETAIAHQDAALLNGLIDEVQMVDRVLAGLDVDQAFRTNFTQGVREGGGLTKLSNEILGAVQRGGDFTFVRMVQKGDELRPLFRLTLPQSGGMNYHELVISVDANKQPRIADIYVYLSGELLSQSIRRLVLPSVAAANAGILAKLTGVESDLIKNIGTIEKINELTSAQKYQEAFDLFGTLPEALQKDKTVLLTKLIVAQNLNDADYINVIRDLERNWPEDAARDFRALDLLSLQEQHSELIKTVDRLIAGIQDPYLNVLKVNSLLALNRVDDARQAVAQAKAVSPNRVDIYWLEVSIALKALDHATTATLLSEIGEKFGMVFDDLTSVHEYAEFVASDIGREWMAEQTAGQAQPAEPVESPSLEPATQPAPAEPQPTPAEPQPAPAEPQTPTEK